jgi:hypothetical protein
MRQSTLSLAAILVAALIPLRSATAHAAGMDFRALDFAILSATNSQPIGRLRYEVNDSRPGFETVTSDARYTDGQYDVERDEFETQKGPFPVMTVFEHDFFRAGGTLLMTSKADFSSGRVTCANYTSGAPVVATETLAFPAGAYAGAAVVLPLQRALRAGQTGPIALYDFVCMPGPKLVKVQALVGPPEPWTHYPGELVRTDIEPDLGWLTYIVAPFLPEIHAWFKPADGFDFVGGQFARFYKGPEIIIRREQVNALAANDRAQQSAAR